MGRHELSDEIRSLVREVLRDALPDLVRGDHGSAFTMAARRSLEGEPAEAVVSLSSDRDLTDFALAVATLAREGDLAAAIASGRLKLRRASGCEGGGPATSAGAPEPASDVECRWDKGVLNEAALVELARRHRRVILGPAAVVTPLARDRARQVRVELVRRRP